MYLSVYILGRVVLEVHRVASLARRQEVVPCRIRWHQDPLSLLALNRNAELTLSCQPHILVKFDGVIDAGVSALILLNKLFGMI